MKTDKIIWAKVGWSDHYQGEPVLGDFDHPLDRRGEQFNFLPCPDGMYRGYTGNQGGKPPSSSEPHGWLVIFVARRPNRPGMHIVGWYENASLVGDYRLRDDVAYPDLDKTLAGPSSPPFSITAAKAFLVRSRDRKSKFSHPSIGSAMFSYLCGPGVEIGENKKRLKATMLRMLKAARTVAEENPRRSAPPQSSDPLLAFGTPEHRKRVEKAAIKEAKRHLKPTHKVKSHEHLNYGYDLHAAPRPNAGASVEEANLHVEVKGTAGKERRFFLTANEHRHRNDPEWRFIIVTDALGSPVLDMMEIAEFESRFDLTPIVWIGREKPKEQA